MDYGQPVKTDSNQPFFTASVGVDSEKAQSSESRDDLNLNNWDYSIDRNHREIGSAAISSSEIPESPLPLPGEQPSANPSIHENPIDNHELSEVVNMTMPMNTTTENSPVTTELTVASTVEIKDEKFTPASVKEVDLENDKLLSGKIEVSDYYNDVRGEVGLRDQNLENSFNRKVGEG